MAAFKRGALFVPSAVQCRHRGKHNVQRPKTHFERMVMEAITRPVLPEDLIDKFTQCPRLQEVQAVAEHQSDFEKFVIRQCQKMFQENSMVIFCQSLSIKMEDRKLIRNKLFHKGMDLVQFSNDIMRKTIEGSPWENLMPLTQGHNLIVTGKDCDLHNMVKIINKAPQLMVLGGVVDDRLLSHAEIMQYSTIPHIDQVRGQLVSILNMASSRTHSLLSTHQQRLTMSLDQYVKDQAGS